MDPHTATVAQLEMGIAFLSGEGREEIECAADEERIDAELAVLKAELASRKTAVVSTRHGDCLDAVRHHSGRVDEAWKLQKRAIRTAFNEGAVADELAEASGLHVLAITAILSGSD